MPFALIYFLAFFSRFFWQVSPLRLSVLRCIGPLFSLIFLSPFLLQPSVSHVKYFLDRLLLVGGISL